MTIHWRALTPDDLGVVAELAQAAVTADGGLVSTASPAFLERRYTADGVTAIGAFETEQLIAVGSVRTVGQTAVAVGLVHPEQRARGIGGELLDRLIAEARPLPGALRVETEALSAEAHQLFASRGLRQTFAEDVLYRSLREPFKGEPLPGELTVEAWTADNQDAFFEAYQASFADRPGFPNWTAQQWIDWTVDDEFLPASSLLARDADGAPAGFVTCAEGFLIQVGVVPQWRQRRLGRALAVAGLERMREASPDGEVFLDVNVDNPASAGLFAGLGFATVARRARYEEAA
ncbi:mycothiol synthase [Allocatelliglobosispora scoriae]|uniref:Mycothiol synthase n=1 Tax=Allocatelliglobosispora scoriae TaxID=643052 RepID=A0A841BL52_9ACTN|nr:GNAT family N-acetyltransferase [Allocatelliglobosispora scoriae]MBB5867540.1 mycothiol synthase [Allocatelliglobosispora scoriae]